MKQLPAADHPAFAVFLHEGKAMFSPVSLLCANPGHAETARPFENQSGSKPIFCRIVCISGFDMKFFQTNPVRPFSIITAIGAWFRPM